MTRINAGIPPVKLSDKHLLAEHREIKRVPNLVRKLWEKGKLKMQPQPQYFCLGTGHIKFFYNKLGYLKKRYLKIRRECRKRGFYVSDFSSAWDGIPDIFMGDWEPTKDAEEIVKKRIKEKSL